MLIKISNKNQFVRESVDITDEKEVWIYNQHQKVLTDNLLNMNNGIPELFLEVVSEEEALKQQKIAALWRKLNEGGEL